MATESFIDEPIANGSVALESEDKHTKDDAPASQSLFVAHLHSYPTVSAAYSYASSLSVVQKISSRAVPIFEAVLEKSKPISEPLIKRASPLLTRADKLGDSILTTVDSKIPQLKTTQPQEFVNIALRPIETVRSTAEAYSTAAHDRFTIRVVKPIQDATETVKAQYASVYDSKGKPLIKTRIDPLLSPLNERIEAIINVYLPNGAEISKYDNEIAHTVQLALLAIKRARPVIDDKATHLKALPKETKAHVQEVYENKRSEYSKEKSPVSSTVYASLATWKQLSSEGVTFAGSVLHPKSTGTEADGIVVN